MSASGHRSRPPRRAPAIDKFASGGLYRPTPSERRNYDPNAEQRLWELVGEAVGSATSHVGALGPLSIGGWDEVQRGDSEFVRIPLIGVTTLRSGALLRRLCETVNPNIEISVVKNATDADVRHFIDIPRGQREPSRSRSQSRAPSYSAPPEPGHRRSRPSAGLLAEVVGVLIHLALVIGAIFIVRYFYLFLRGEHSWGAFALPDWLTVWPLIRQGAWWIMGGVFGMISSAFGWMATAAAGASPPPAAAAAAAAEQN
jgi:hypothetical protein